VSNAALTADFGYDYLVGDGYVDLVMSSSNALGTGGGTFAYVTFLVNWDAGPGALSDLTISRLDLGDQYGGDLGWTYGVESSNGVVWAVLDGAVDSDGDGLFDYDEQTWDGNLSYNPWDAASNPYGTDPDVTKADTDGDGMVDGDEKVAGTSPLNAGEVLVLEGLGEEVTGFRVTWQSVDGIEYTVQRTTNMSVPFTAIASNIVGVAPQNSHTDTNAPAGMPAYYRILVEEE
jgi:hypothetical protein